MENMKLLNLNGFIGRGAYEESQFPTIQSLVGHLDSLGIERSLAWHVTARDINPSLGNRMLLNEIDRSNLGERILPAFVITPACFFELGTLDFLKENLSGGRVRALRIIPEVSRFEIRQLERLLSGLSQYEPVILWDCRHGHNELAIRDFEYLAQRFPMVSFVVTQKMWGGFGSILDLMWRCPNTYIDTSWLHMRDTIELLVERFGPERILFGTGFRSHNGAAIGSLVHADITDSQREQIAHLNAERILKIPCTKRNKIILPDPGKDKSLWNAFRSGKAVENVEIIDAHGHTPPFTRGWVYRQNDIKKGMEDTLRRMDRLGINRIVLTFEPAIFGPNCEYNTWGEELLKEYSPKLSGYLAYNPIYRDEMVPEFDRFFRGGFFVGFKLLPGYLKTPLTDSCYQPVWEYADRYRRPILIHTWGDNYGSPSRLTDISRKYPGASFILGHSGGGTSGRLEAEELALSTNNVYLEFCGSFTTPRPFETSLMKVGKEKVLYGSDTVAHDMAWELSRYLSMPVPDEILLPGLGANMRKILSRTISP